MDSLKLIFHAYNDVSELSNDELKELILDILDIEEIPSAVRELYLREPNTAKALGKNILEKKLGDRFLQAAVFDSIFSRDPQYATEFIETHLQEMDAYVYAEVLEELSMESDQAYGKSLPGRLLGDIAKRYLQYSISEKSDVREFEERYEAFLTAYKGRF